MDQTIVGNTSDQTNNNENDAVNQMDKLSELQDRLKRKVQSEEEQEVPTKKAKDEFFENPCSSKTVPTLETMGIDKPLDPDYSRLPKGFDLGILAREKFAGIVKADIRDRYELQIYCRLFEHFSHYPIYKFDKDIWISAHDHAYAEILNFRIPPSVLMRRARAARHSQE